MDGTTVRSMSFSLGHISQPDFLGGVPAIGCAGMLLKSRYLLSTTVYVYRWADTQKHLTRSGAHFLVFNFHHKASFPNTLSCQGDDSI